MSSSVSRRSTARAGGAAKSISTRSVAKVRSYFQVGGLGQAWAPAARSTTAPSDDHGLHRVLEEAWMMLSGLYASRLARVCVLGGFPAAVHRLLRLSSERIAWRVADSLTPAGFPGSPRRRRTTTLSDAALIGGMAVFTWVVGHVLPSSLRSGRSCVTAKASGIDADASGVGAV